MEGTRFNADCSVHLAEGGIQNTYFIFIHFDSYLSPYILALSRKIFLIFEWRLLSAVQTYSPFHGPSRSTLPRCMILPALFSRFSRKALNNADDCIGWLTTFSTRVMSLTLFPHLSKVILTFRKNSKWLSVKQPTLKVSFFSEYRGDRFRVSRLCASVRITDRLPPVLREMRYMFTPRPSPTLSNHTSMYCRQLFFTLLSTSVSIISPYYKPLFLSARIPKTWRSRTYRQICSGPQRMNRQTYRCMDRTQN